VCVVAKLADVGVFGELTGPQRQQDGPSVGEMAAESLRRGVMLGQEVALLDRYLT
jgi:hypothetical protein